jgi:Lrp/AsnC family transcriptional regulator, leucine-responsive regulatory protein
VDQHRDGSEHPVDEALLRILSKDADRSTKDIAEEVGYSEATVRRRKARLKESGAIKKYVAVVDHNRIGPSLEGYVEMTFEGTVDVEAELARVYEKYPQVRETSVVAGDVDAMVRLRVRDTAELKQVVLGMRRSLQGVRGTKILLALDRTRQDSRELSADLQSE